MAQMVCENHPGKKWPEQCQCGAGMPKPEYRNLPADELDAIAEAVWADFAGRRYDIKAYAKETARRAIIATISPTTERTP